MYLKYKYSMCCSELLKQLMDSNSSGSALPSADLAKLLEQSENMVKEMERRSFTTQKDAAKKEQAEANKCIYPLIKLPISLWYSG